VLASPRVDATGTWHGEYRYGPEQGLAPVAFTLRLTQDTRGHLTGTVLEHPPGTPEEGRILGTCRRGRVDFLKLMPVARVSAANGTQELRIFLAEAGHAVDGPIEHPQILYQGRLAADGRTMSGTWRLDDYVVPLADGQVFRLPGGEGAWAASRVAE
jgi:hypothetical protein